MGQKSFEKGEVSKLVVQAKNDFLIENLSPEELKVRIGKARMGLMMACVDCDQEGTHISDRNSLTGTLNEKQLLKKIHEDVQACLKRRYPDYLEAVAVRDALVRRYGIHDDADEDIKNLDSQIARYLGMKKTY